MDASNELFVVVETRFVWDGDERRTEERPVGVFFTEVNATAWCDQNPDRYLTHWPVPALDA